MTSPSAHHKGKVCTWYALTVRRNWSAARPVDVWPVPVLGQALKGRQVGGARPVLPVVQVPALALARRLLWPVRRTLSALLRPLSLQVPLVASLCHSFLL